MEKIGNGGKGIAWNTQSEMDLLRKLNYTKADGPAKGQPMLNTAIDAAEMILTLAPETNGHVAVKAWAALSEFTGRDHTHLATNKEEEKSASAISRPSRAKLSPARPGLALKMSMSLITRVIPTFMSSFHGAPSPVVSSCIRTISGCVTSVKACWSIVRPSTPVQ
jgi:nitrate reductase alpha subunit